VQQPAPLPPIAINRSIPVRKARPQGLPPKITGVPSTRARKVQQPALLPPIAEGLSTPARKELPLVQPLPIGISRRSRELRVRQ